MQAPSNYLSERGIDAPNPHRDGSLIAARFERVRAVLKARAARAADLAAARDEAAAALAQGGGSRA